MVLYCLDGDLVYKEYEYVAILKNIQEPILSKKSIVVKKMNLLGFSLTTNNLFSPFISLLLLLLFF